MTIKLTPHQQMRAAQLARMTPREWDAICKRCGVCCLIKIRGFLIDEATGTTSEKTTYLNRCCDKFDTKTRQCSIYNTRLNNMCCRKVDMNVVLSGNLLPASCGYVEYIFGPAPYPARVDFNQVRPVTENEIDNMSDTELERDIILESVLWNERNHTR